MQYLHSMIRVSDLDQTLDFFCTKLGFTELSRNEHEKGRFTLVFLAAPGDVGPTTRRAGMQGSMPRGSSRAGKRDAEPALDWDPPLLELTYNWDEKGYTGGRNFGHLAYRVEDIYGLCERLMAAGVTINRPPHDGHMAFIRSPDGISIELLQAGESLPVKEPWKSMPNTGTW